MSGDAPAPPDATVLARALADAHDVDLRTVAGRGPGGRIEEADVVAALVAIAAPEPPPLLDADDLRGAVPLLDEGDL